MSPRQADEEHRVNPRSALGAVLGHRWVRRTLTAGITLAVVFGVLVTVGANGGVVVRDGDGCPRTIGSLGSVSWVDVLQHEDRTYERVDIVAPHVSRVDPSRLGEPLGTVRCSMADAVQAPGYDLRDGEATFLAPGTTVHALADTAVRFRVVVIDDGEAVVYEHRPVRGTTGADLLPFAAQDVEAVIFLSEVDGRTVLGTLTDPGVVRSFVEDLHAAPVGDRPDLGDEPRVFVSLAFADQPPVTIVTYPGHAVTTAGLRLPDAVLERIPAPVG